MSDQTFPQWRPISTAPVDEHVLLATTGGWVGGAIFGEDEEEPTWRWVDNTKPLHPKFTPLGWMPLPPAITEPAGE